MGAPGIRRVLETCLYVDDMERARRFYEEVIGLEPGISDERITAYRAGDTMLLLFTRGGTREPVKLPTGTIPPHDGHGPAHFAFSIRADSLEAWRDHLEANGVSVISTVKWPDANSTSLYFHDPDGHVVELATPGLWGIE